MLVEFRSPVFAAVFDCARDALVGDLASDLEFIAVNYAKLENTAAAAALSPALCETATRLRQSLDEGEVVGLNEAVASLSTLFTREPPPAAAAALESELTTLFWMKKPLSRSSKLEEYNKNERTKLVVVLGKELGPAPDLSQCKEAKRNVKQNASKTRSQIIASAREIAMNKSFTESLVSPEGLQALQSNLAISPENMYKMALVCTAPSPEATLGALLSEDASFRAFSDQVLLHSKRAKLDAESNIEIIPLPPLLPAMEEEEEEEMEEEE